jgi:hypothetical protein
MDLILWRHAEAHVAKEGQDDPNVPSRPRVSARRSAWPNG